MSDHETRVPPADPDDYREYEKVLTEPLGDLLARSAHADDEWLWCIYCKRFFQARFLRIDFLGNREGCAFCGAAGFNVAIHQWDAFREDGDEGWPASEAELGHGMRLHDRKGR